MSNTISAELKLEAVLRELAYRRRVYPRRVAENKMTEHLARVQIGIMEAIADDYREMARKERLV